MSSSSTDAATTSSNVVEHVGNYIDGAWCNAEGGATLPVVDPATDEVIAEVPASAHADVDRAVGAATRARTAWARTTPRERSELLLELAERLQRDAGSFERIESWNAGKPISTTAGEVSSAVDRLRFFAGAARVLEGRAAGEYAAGYTSMIRREPVGVTALITPWNYPILTAVTKLSPALAAGNTVVLKPSEVTPLTALRLASLADGLLPPGVLNVVNGTGADVGPSLVEHPDVDLVSLTGGTVTGKAVAQAAARTVKRVHLELGGKAPAVVLDDADPGAVARSLRSAAFWNAGQDCSAATRVIVTDAAYESVLAALVDQVGSLAVGDPQDATTEMGPLSHAAHRDRVVGFLQRAHDSEVRFVLGGDRIAGPGCFVQPTIITDVAQDHELVQQEVFGPVLCVQRAPDAETAITLANDVAYGLGASVFTQDVGRAMAAARDLRFGTVWVNDHGAVSAEMPWGGFKESGYGKERSVYSLEDFTEIKHVMVRLPDDR